MSSLTVIIFFFFNDTATTEIYTLSLHDALPISNRRRFDHDPDRPHRQHARGCDVRFRPDRKPATVYPPEPMTNQPQDRKSTRLNCSHGYISYAVFCLKKKKKNKDK